MTLGKLDHYTERGRRSPTKRSCAFSHVLHGRWRFPALLVPSRSRRDHNRSVVVGFTTVAAIFFRFAEMERSARKVNTIASGLS